MGVNKDLGKKGLKQRHADAAVKFACMRSNAVAYVLHRRKLAEAVKKKRYETYIKFLADSLSRLSLDDDGNCPNRR